MSFTHFYLVFVVVTSAYRLWVSNRIPGVSKTEGKVKAPATFWMLTAAYAVVVSASVVEYFLLRNDSLHFRYSISSIGLLVYLIGILGREWPIRTLKEFWSHQIEIRASHRLILGGPYHYLRHPNYFCLLCEVLGFPLISNSYIAFVLAVVIYLPLIRIRIRHEEAALVEKFGDTYRAYMHCVPALFPVPGRTAAPLKSGVSSTPLTQPEDSREAAR